MGKGVCIRVPWGCKMVWKGCRSCTCMLHVCMACLSVGALHCSLYIYLSVLLLVGDEVGHPARSLLHIHVHSCLCSL